MLISASNSEVTTSLEDWADEVGRLALVLELDPRRTKTLDFFSAGRVTRENGDFRLRGVEPIDGVEQDPGVTTAGDAMEPTFVGDAVLGRDTARAEPKYVLTKKPTFGALTLRFGDVRW